MRKLIIVALAGMLAAASATGGEAEQFVVQVNGRGLTREQFDKRVAGAEEMHQRLIQTHGGRGPHRIGYMKEVWKRQIVGEFIIDTTLSNAATRADVELTTADVAAERQRILAEFQEGISVEEYVRRKGVSEEDLTKAARGRALIAKYVAATRPDLLEVTESEVAKCDGSERMTVRHILFGVPQDATPEVKAEKLRKAEDVLNKLREGADFGEMVRRHSECPSRNRGGVMVVPVHGHPLSKAALARQDGTIGPVVQTQYGYSILEVTADVTTMRREELLARKRYSARATVLSNLCAAADIVYAPGFEPGPLPPPFR